MTPTRGLPFAARSAGLGQLLDGVGLGVERRLGEVGRDLDEPAPQRRVDVRPVRVLGGRPLDDEVVRRGQRRQRRRRPRHVDDRLLRAGQEAGGQHGGAAQHVGLAAPHGHRGTQQPGEHAAPAGSLGAGLDGVQHADDPHGVAGATRRPAGPRRARGREGGRARSPRRR